jgi:pyridoxine 4-dehydrogenase
VRATPETFEALGPLRDRLESLDVLRHAVAEGVNHIDTAQFCGPDVANELIHAALYPYPEELELDTRAIDAIA